ncbi:MAG: dTDP-4-dehydrorhamnose reductase [Gemmatimonadetes bacterium]|nr:dTDP-4-dehydrorhamnose reductase [Gemmatimonadota bacterium]
MKILVTGAGGLLGSAVVSEGGRRGHDMHPFQRQTLDVTDKVAVSAAVAECAPGTVIHCAAYTNVDLAESERDVAVAVNRDGTENVARAAASAGALMVYISTDFVFDGRSERPYTPDDPPNPINHYGRSKLAGEEVVRQAGGAWTIVRGGWFYGEGGRDFVDVILERARAGRPLRVVDDQVGVPSWTGSVAPALLDLIEKSATGVLHLCDRGEVTRVDWARAALTLAGVDLEVEPVSSEAFAAPAERPAYSVLNGEAAEAILGRAMAEWSESLRTYLEAA